MAGRRKKEPRRYEIDSFQKLINTITEDNFQGITTDLMLWLHYNITFIKGVQEEGAGTMQRQIKLRLVQDDIHLDR